MQYEFATHHYHCHQLSLYMRTSKAQSHPAVIDKGAESLDFKLQVEPTLTQIGPSPMLWCLASPVIASP